MRYSCRMIYLHPKKLLKTKWTALAPKSKEKHFIVSKVILPDRPNENPRTIEIEAVYTRRTTRIEWKELRDETRWRQGWD